MGHRMRPEGLAPGRQPPPGAFAGDYGLVALVVVFVAMEVWWCKDAWVQEWVFKLWEIGQLKGQLVSLRSFWVNLLFRSLLTRSTLGFKFEGLIAGAFLYRLFQGGDSGVAYCSGDSEGLCLKRAWQRLGIQFLTGTG